MPGQKLVEELLRITPLVADAGPGRCRPLNNIFCTLPFRTH